MTVGEAIRAVLLEMPAVTALVGQRIRIGKLRQSEPTFPVICVHRIDQHGAMHLRGASGIKEARVQVDSVAMEGSGVDHMAVAFAVDAAVDGPGDGTGLLGFTGSIGSPTFTIHSVRPAGLRDGYDADELKQFKVMRDYTVRFTEG